MTTRQWLVITGVVVLNLIILSTLLHSQTAAPPATPTAVWTAAPTFTPAPWPTATAIVMPTDAAFQSAATSTPVPTPPLHIVREGETLDTIAARYGISAYGLRMLNRLGELDTIQVGQTLIVPPMQ